MSGKKGFRIFINVLTVISTWFFIAGFVNIINVVNRTYLRRVADDDGEYVFAVLITVFLTVGGAAIIAWHIAYEISADKKRKKSKTFAEGEELSAESQLY